LIFLVAISVFGDKKIAVKIKDSSIVNLEKNSKDQWHHSDALIDSIP